MFPTVLLKLMAEISITGSNVPDCASR